MNNKKYIIGIDAGTSMIKAVLFNIKGEEVNKKGIVINTNSPSFNWIEEDMDVIWDNVKKCITDVIQNIDKNSIAGIGITAQGDGTWMINSKGNPVRPGICWCDGRAPEILDEWYKDGTAGDVFDICGTAINTGTQSVQLKWLEKNEPKSIKEAMIIFHAKDWIYYKLTGKISTDETDESLPMLNMKTRKYDEELFNIFDLQEIKEKFPKVYPCHKNYTTIAPDMADELNLPIDLIISSGPMDVSACALGLGLLNEGQACSILGTAAIHEVVMSSPDLKPRLVGMTICHCKVDSWIRIIASMTATPNLEWFLKEIGYKLVDEADKKNIDVYKYINEIVENVPAGSRGLIYHPYLFPGGERGPFVDPNARASFTGLTLNNTVNDMLRAVFEGVAFAMRDCYSNVNTEISEIRLSGGGAKSDTWCQIFADVLNKKIIITEGEELGAKGAALNCGVAVGIYNNYEEAVERTIKIKKIYTPNHKNKGIYDDLFELYKLTYKQLKESWEIRAKIMNKRDDNG